MPPGRASPSSLAGRSGVEHTHRPAGQVAPDGRPTNDVDGEVRRRGGVDPPPCRPPPLELTTPLVLGRAATMDAARPWLGGARGVHREIAVRRGGSGVDVEHHLGRHLSTAVLRVGDLLGQPPSSPDPGQRPAPRPVLVSIARTGRPPASTARRGSTRSLVLEVDEAGRPAPSSEGVMRRHREVAAPVVLRDEDLTGRDDLLDVGRVPPWTRTRCSPARPHPQRGCCWSGWGRTDPSCRHSPVSEAGRVLGSPFLPAGR